MFISPEEIRARAESKDNLVNSIEFRRLHSGGRNIGDTNLDNEARAQLGALARLISPVEIAEKLGISDQAIYNYRNGQSTQGTPNPELQSKKAVKEDKIVDKAADILLSTLGNLDNLDLNDKADIKKAKGIASISKSLADIHAKISGNVKKYQTPESDSSRARVVIYAPNMKSLTDYGEVIEVEKAS